MLKINISNQAQKFLKNIHIKHGKQLSKKIMELRSNPAPNDCKKISGYPFVRVDCGEYRIIYTFDKITLEIILIGKRNDDQVYKNLKKISY